MMTALVSLYSASNNPAEGNAGSSGSNQLSAVTFSSTDLSELPVFNGPLSLHDALNKALANNLSLQVTQYDVKAQNASLKGETAKQWPMISAFSLTFLIGGHSAFFRAPSLLYPVINFHKVINQEFGVYVRSPMLIGNGLRGAIKAQKYLLSAAQEQYKIEAIDLAHKVRKTYLDAAFLKEQVRLYQQLLVIKHMHVTGEDSKRSLLETNDNLLSTRKQLDNTLLELKTLLGLNLGSTPMLTDRLRFHPFKHASDLQAMNRQLQYHPKLKRCDAQLKSAVAMVQSVKSGLYPDIFAEASGNFRVPQNPSLGFGNGAIAMFATVFPAFDKTVYAKIDTAQVQVQEVLEQKQMTQKKIRKEFEQAWNKHAFEATYMQKRYKILSEHPPDGMTFKQVDLDNMPAYINAILSSKTEDLKTLYLQLDLLQDTFNHEQSVSDLLQAAGLLF